MSDYYDWHRTLTYNADLTMVIDLRGSGKTYGMRLQCVRDHLQDGCSTFVEICRFEEETKDVASGYYDRIEENGEFPDHVFKSSKAGAFIARRPKDGERPEWERIGYFVTMTQYQRAKKKTYNKVRRIIMDEALIEPNDRFHRYLPNEYEIFVSIVDTVTRQHLREPGSSGLPHAYLLGNAVDLVNPYFQHFGIRKLPKHGYSWHGGKTMLLHYCESEGRGEAKADHTLAGRLGRGLASSTANVINEFDMGERESYIYARLPAGCSHVMDMVARGRRMSLLADMSEGMYYVRPAHRGSSGKCFYLTARDGSIGNVSMQVISPRIRELARCHGLGSVMYEDFHALDAMLEVYRAFGFR